MDVNADRRLLTDIVPLSRPMNIRLVWGLKSKEDAAAVKNIYTYNR